MARDVPENLLDKAIAWVAPRAAVKRRVARAALAASGGYTGARRDRRATQAWSTASVSADAALLPDLAALRDRSRDLERNAPLAAGALATVTTNVVGTGLKLAAQIDARALGLGDAQAEQWEQDAEAEFALWAESQECDLARTLDFAGYQELALRSCLSAGDVFVFLRYLDRPGSPYGLKLQGIEGDRVCNPGRGRDTATLAAGVELDAATGAPLAYHVTDRHPGDTLSPAALKWTRYPAFTEAGRRAILHVYKPTRFEMHRGVPFLAPVIESLKQLDRYGDAELMAAVVNACFAIVSQTETGAPALSPLATTPSPSDAGSGNAEALKRVGLDFEPGLVIDGLKPGEGPQSFRTDRPNSSFDPFVLAVLRQVGVALEIPYEVLIKHFTASYSAARAALLEAWKMFRTRRVWLADALCQPVYETFLAEAIARGRLKAPGFFRDPALRKAWCGAEWVGPAAGQIDPEKEAAANEIMVRNGWKTDAEVTAEMTGGDFDRKIRVRAREQGLKRTLGLEQAPPPPGGAAAPPQAPAEQPNPDRPEQEDAA